MRRPGSDDPIGVSGNLYKGQTQKDLEEEIVRRKPKILNILEGDFFHRKERGHQCESKFYS